MAIAGGERREPQAQEWYTLPFNAVMPETATSSKIPRSELFDLYRIAIDEYRFEVKLNNDRKIHYLVFNAAIFSAGTGLWKIGGARAIDAFVAVVFLVGVFAAYLGVTAVKRGHEYYRRTVYKKALIEELLGLHQPMRDHPSATLAITTTRGHAEVVQMLNDPEAWLGTTAPHQGTITRASIMVLWWIGVANLVGFVVTFLGLLHRFFPGVPAL